MSRTFPNGTPIVASEKNLQSKKKLPLNVLSKFQLFSRI